MHTSAALQAAFYSAEIGMDEYFSPKVAVTIGMAVGSTALLDFLNSPGFWKTWGYKDKDEAARLIGLRTPDDGQPDAAELELLRPLRALAFEGKIRKEEFVSLRGDMVFRHLLHAAKTNEPLRLRLMSFVEDRRRGYDMHLHRQRLQFVDELLQTELIPRNLGVCDISLKLAFMNFPLLVFAVSGHVPPAFMYIMTPASTIRRQAVAGFSRIFEAIFGGRSLDSIPITDADYRAVGIDPRTLTAVMDDPSQLRLQRDMTTLQDCLERLYGTGMGIALLSAAFMRFTAEQHTESAAPAMDSSPAVSRGPHRRHLCVLF